MPKYEIRYYSEYADSYRLEAACREALHAHHTSPWLPLSRRRASGWPGAGGPLPRGCTTRSRATGGGSADWGLEPFTEYHHSG